MAPSDRMVIASFVHLSVLDNSPILQNNWTKYYVCFLKFLIFVEYSHTSPFHEHRSSSFPRSFSAISIILSPSGFLFNIFLLKSFQRIISVHGHFLKPTRLHFFFLREFCEVLTANITEYKERLIIYIDKCTVLSFDLI